LPGGATGMLVRGYKGKKADQLVTRIGPGVVSLVAELVKCCGLLKGPRAAGSTVGRRHRPRDLTATRAFWLSRSAGIGCAGLETVFDQRGADMVDVPGGASGLLVRHYKPRKPIGW
jgi:hypothetical protein